MNRCRSVDGTRKPGPAILRQRVETWTILREMAGLPLEASGRLVLRQNDPVGPSLGGETFLNVVVLFSPKHMQASEILQTTGRA